MAVREEWAYQGPALHELVDDVSVIRTHSRCALVIPVKDEADLLNEHLGKLGKQTTADFDAVILHSPALDLSKVKKDSRFGLVFVREKTPMGLTSGFYAGQKFALEKGYETVILADVDAYPVSGNLVQKLQEAAVSDKKSIFVPSLDSVSDSSDINWYGAMNRLVLEKGGLTYMPFYYGLDVSEITVRMRNMGFNIINIPDVSAFHDNFKHTMSLKSLATRILYSLRNGAFVNYSYPELIRFSIFGMGYLAFFENFRNFRARLPLSALLFRSLLSPRLFRNTSFEQVSVPEYPDADSSVLRSPRTRALIIEEHWNKEKLDDTVRMLKEKGTSYKIVSKRGGLGLDFFREAALSAFSYDSLVIAGFHVALFNPVTLLAKNLYYHDGSRITAVSENCSLPKRLFRCLASAIFLAGITACYSILSFFVWLGFRKPFEGYGTRDAQ
jgi:GT2 family glycosyltransferase